MEHHHALDFNHHHIGALIADAEPEHGRSITSRAPIMLLPNEILSAILETGHFPSSSDLSTPPFELLVSQVTAQWRNTALSTPQLWTRIRIEFRRSSRDKIETYLPRSGALPLDFHLVIGMKPISELNEIFHLTADLALINCHSNRWRRLRVDSTWRSMVLDKLLEMLPSTVPFLEHVQISSTVWHVEEPMVERDIFIGGAPSLTIIRVRGLCWLPHSPTVTNLQLYSAVPSSMLASVLNDLPALKLLTIHGVFGEWETPNTNIFLPSLNQFHLITWEIHQMPDLLNLISAPLLHSLLLENMMAYDIDDFVASLDLTSDLVKYPPLRNLTMLTAEGSIFEPISWMNIIRAFPTITHFTVMASYLLDNLLTALHPSKSTVAGWPELHTLTLINRSKPPHPILLCDTLSARIASGHPIRKLCLSPSITTALLHELEWLHARAEVEETSLYSDFDLDRSFVVHWSHDDE